jgi:hypothetical protein
MKIGDRVCAKHPYAGVPAGEGVIIKAITHPNNPTQFLVRFVIKAERYKDFYLSERELEGALTELPPDEGQSPPALAAALTENSP